MKLIFQLLVLMHVSIAAFGNTNCALSKTETNICVEAKRISDEIAIQLPLQMSDDMTWESVFAIENTIQGELLLSYDQETFEGLLLQSGKSMDQARSAMQEAAFMVCAEGSPTRSFIDAGGGRCGTIIDSWMERLFWSSTLPSVLEGSLAQRLRPTIHNSH